MPLRHSSLEPALASEFTNKIEQLLTELRLAQSYRADGPHVLILINELCLAFEDFFALEEASYANRDGVDTSHMARTHQNFMREFVVHAEKIRVSNGVLEEDFFVFIDNGPYYLATLAA